MFFVVVVVVVFVMCDYVPMFFFLCSRIKSGTIMKRKKFNKKKYYRVSYAGNVETDQLQKNIDVATATKRFSSYTTLFF